MACETRMAAPVSFIRWFGEPTPLLLFHLWAEDVDVINPSVIAGDYPFNVNTQECHVPIVWRCRKLNFLGHVLTLQRICPAPNHLAIHLYVHSIPGYKTHIGEVDPDLVARLY